MATPLHSEQATLSLVGNHNHAIEVDAPQLQDSIEDVLARLPAVLQTSLELDTIINLFHKEISKVLPYSSMHYKYQDHHCDVMPASRSHHSCNYRLEMNKSWLGELTLTRRTKFSDEDTQVFEELLCKLIYPLRNCILFRQAQAAALNDALTGLHNRGAFDNSLKREMDIAQRQHLPMSLLVIDIDHFKAVNDTYGHGGGDHALQLLAQSISNTMRTSDLAFRYGGEEFTLILSNTDVKAASLVAERIRIAASKLTCVADNKNFGLTISIGAAEFKQGEAAAALFDRADQALYQAKKTGRNKMICAD